MLIISVSVQRLAGNTADEIESIDSQLAGSEKDSIHLKRLMRSYIVSAGFEEDIKFIFCMNHFVCSFLAESEFIEQSKS